jgi:hypothetical protein
VKEAVSAGELSMKDLDEKVARILAVKDFLQKRTPQLGTIKNSKIVALSTKKLREIESRILDFNIKVALRNSPPNIDERSPAALPEKNSSSKICIFSPTKDFIYSFKTTNTKFSAVRITAKTSSKIVSDHMTKYNCRYGIFVIHGPKTASLLSKLPTVIAKRLLVINLNSPSLVSTPEKFINVVNLFFPHPDAGKKVAENLRALARRSSIGNFAHIHFD